MNPTCPYCDMAMREVIFGGNRQPVDLYDCNCLKGSIVRCNLRGGKERWTRIVTIDPDAIRRERMEREDLAKWKASAPDTIRPEQKPTLNTNGKALRR